jgi:NTP pyrophosphatase (non-canonical NTP hydrolase)
MKDFVVIYRPRQTPDGGPDLHTFVTDISGPAAVDQFLRFFPEYSPINVLTVEQWVCEKAKENNPDTYRDNIVELIDRQREKGLKKYGQTLEQNTTLSTLQRIEHAQEELVDALQYLEHLKQTQADKLTANDYQRAAMRTASGMNYEGLRGEGQLLNAVMGLNGEAGECIDIVKKHLFQGHDLDRDHLAEELGDTAWYLAVCCDALGMTLEEVLQHNIDKLKARYPEGFDKARSINREEGPKNG